MLMKYAACFVLSNMKETINVTFFVDVAVLQTSVRL